MAKAHHRRRRVYSAAAASLLVHGAILTWLVLNFTFVAQHLVDQPDVTIAVLRRPRSAGSRAPRTKDDADVARSSPAAADAAPGTAPHAPGVETPRPATAKAVFPPAVDHHPTTAVGAGRPDAADTSAFGAVAGDLRDALRSLLGCSGDHGRLTMDERARCSEKLGLVARTAAKVDVIPAEKRAYYDAVAAAYAKAHGSPGDTTRSPSGVQEVAGERTMSGLTVPLAGCSLRFGAPRGWKSYHDKPPHSLTLASIGPLHCFVPPPTGRGFEESSLVGPASLRERTDNASHMKALDVKP